MGHFTCLLLMVGVPDARLQGGAGGSVTDTEFRNTAGGAVWQGARGRCRVGHRGVQEISFLISPVDSLAGNSMVVKISPSLSSTIEKSMRAAPPLNAL